jgi:hypothetical protein
VGHALPSSVVAVHGVCKQYQCHSSGKWGVQSAPPSLTPDQLYLSSRSGHHYRTADSPWLSSPLGPCDSSAWGSSHFAPATSILTPIDHDAKVLWLPASLRLSRPQQAKAVGALCLHTGAHKPWIPSSLGWKMIVGSWNCPAPSDRSYTTVSFGAADNAAVSL